MTQQRLWPRCRLSSSCRDVDIAEFVCEECIAAVCGEAGCADLLGHRPAQDDDFGGKFQRLISQVYGVVVDVGEKGRSILHVLQVAFLYVPAMQQAPAV